MTTAEPIGTIDHARSLCGKPDVPENTPRENLKDKPAHCLCCDTEMLVKETSSTGMQQLGMYWLICPVCPTEEKLQIKGDDNTTWMSVIVTDQGNGGAYCGKCGYDFGIFLGRF